MRHKLYILIIAVSTSCVFLIGCKNRNNSPPAQTCPGDSNNPKPAGIANSNNYHYTPPHPTDSNDPALVWILNDDYQAVKSFYDLPKDVRIAILPEPPKSARLGRMAEPNEPFNSTDLIREDYPSRRFITGGFSKDYAFVFYEHGGRGYNQPLVILKRNNGKADIILFGYCREDLFSLDQLKTAIIVGRMKGENDRRFWNP